MERSLHVPRASGLSSELGATARRLAERLRAAGFEHWLVGGSVRDLALGIEPHDVDLATDATPDEVEELFERTLPVGKAFGTVVVLDGPLEAQVTTFRTEGGYSDGRRPDRVAFGSTLEEDAARRDFTCNALYLDPLTDTIADPVAGLEDLRRGELRCVGDPSERFAEDALRVLRLARFAARYDLSVDEETVDAARANATLVKGLAPERVRGELERIAAGPAPDVATGLLLRAGVLEARFPGHEVRREALVALGAGSDREVDLVLWIALLFAEPQEIGEALRVTRKDLEALRSIRSLREELRAQGTRRPEHPRAAGLRLLRTPRWRTLRRVLAVHPLDAPSDVRLAELDALEREVPEPSWFPDPLLTSADLASVGVPRGPRWGELLREAETLQLEGELVERTAALDWLAQQTRDEDADGRANA